MVAKIEALDSEIANVHCTMGKLKKIAESGLLWELISPQSFAENTHNFTQCCVNSPRIAGNLVLKKLKKGVKRAKNMLLMFIKVKLGVKKIVLVNA